VEIVAVIETTADPALDPMRVRPLPCAG